MTSVMGIIGFLVLTLLPGCWLTFCLRIAPAQLPISVRLLVGAALSPVVVVLEFYAIRLFGATFQQSVPVLVVLNLPVLYALRKAVSPALPNLRSAGVWVLVLLVPAALISRQLLDLQGPLYGGHSWLYSGPAYLVANGELLLEDPDLAGIRLGYPWAGLAYQAILSYMLNSPPAVSYIWTNLVGLVIICGLMSATVSELGGNRFSSITSVAWLFFGVNFVGFFLEQFSGLILGEPLFRISGDYRYTPWLLKFLFFEQEPITLAMFTAIVYLSVTRWSPGIRSPQSILVFALLLGISVEYPLLFPAAAAVVAATAVAISLEAVVSGRALPNRQLLVLGIAIIVTTIVSLLVVRLLSQDRATPALYLSPRWLMKWKTITAGVVTSPLVAGLFLVFATCWRAKRGATLILILSAAASCFLFAVFDIPGFGNEYKFIFTAAICLSPFPSLALEPLMTRLGTKAYPVFILITLVLATPFAYKMYYHWPWYASTGLAVAPPEVDVANFNLRLGSNERFSALSDAVRERTPASSLLVTDIAELHFPALTQRALYVPAKQRKPQPGVNVASDDILTISRGYDKQVIEGRRLVLNSLFQSDDVERRTMSLGRILELGRPTAIVVDETRHASLFHWLQEAGGASLVFRENDLALWLVVPPEREAERVASKFP